MQKRDRVTTSEGSLHVIILCRGSMFSLEVCCCFLFFLLNPRNGWCGALAISIYSISTLLQPAKQFHTLRSLSLCVFFQVKDQSGRILSVEGLARAFEDVKSRSRWCLI